MVGRVIKVKNNLSADDSEAFFPHEVIGDLSAVTGDSSILL